MKYHIDTIPVWDALHQNTECLLCSLRKRTEDLLVERSLGGSVMSPDTRIKVNETGFCAHHQAKLYQTRGGNRLGHALMMLSHLQTLRPKYEKAIKAAPGAGKTASNWGFLRKPSPGDSADNKGPLAALSAGCLLCEELTIQSQRQIASLLHLWKTDSAFGKAFAQSKGLCLPDTALAHSMAQELLSGDSRQRFIALSSNLLGDSLKRLEEDLSWFTQKFDYRNADKPWNNAKDALERTVNKLQGWCLGEDNP